MMDIFQVIDALPEGVTKVSLFVGNERQQLDRVHTFDHSADAQAIQDKLREEGYGSEFKHARVIFRNEKGKQLKSWSVRKNIPQEVNPLQASHDSLVAGYLSMQRNYAEFFTHMTERLDSSDEKFDRMRREDEKRMDKLRQDLLAMQYELMEAKTRAAALDVASQEADDNDNTKFDRVASVVETLGAAYIYGKEDRLTPEGFMEEATNNPSFIESLMGNEAVASFIKDKFFKSKLAPDSVEDVKELETKEATEEQ